MKHNFRVLASISPVCINNRNVSREIISDFMYFPNGLTLSLWRSLSCRNQFIDLLSKSTDWFLYDKNLRQERVKWK